MRESACRCPACGAPVTRELGGRLCAACLVALAFDEDDEVAGETASSRSPVHAYQVVSVLGREPGRTRYLARRRDFHAFVSLEIIRSSVLADVSVPALDARLDRLSSLRHPAIARLLESWPEASGDWCLVSEYLVGRVLAPHVRLPAAGGTTLAGCSPLVIFDRICQALSAAHAHGVMHGRLEAACIVLVGGDIDVEPRLTGFTLTSSPPTLADDLAGLGTILATLTAGHPFAGQAAALAAQATREDSALRSIEAIRSAVAAWRA